MREGQRETERDRVRERGLVSERMKAGRYKNQL